METDTKSIFFLLEKSLEQNLLNIFVSFLSSNTFDIFYHSEYRGDFWHLRSWGLMTMGSLTYVKDELCPANCGSERYLPNGKWILTESSLVGNEGWLWKASNHDQILVVLTSLKYTLQLQYISCSEKNLIMQKSNKRSQKIWAFTYQTC